MLLEENTANSTSYYLLDRHAALSPTKVALVGDSYSLTYSELATLAQKAANIFEELAAQEGDRIIIALPDSAEFIAAFLAAARMGYIAVPISPFLTSKGYYSYLSHSKARIAIVHESALTHVFEIAQQLCIVLLVVGGASCAYQNCLKWNELITSASAHLSSHAKTATDGIFLLYSSGSTGRPKAVIHRYSSLLVTATSIAKTALGIKSNDTLLSVAKLHFAYGLGNSMSFPLFTGATSLLDAGRPNVRRTLTVISQHRPSVFFATPTFLEALLQELRRNHHLYDMSSIRLMLSAGERLLPHISEAFDHEHNIEVLDGFGATETLHHFMLTRPGRSTSGSCGTAVPHCELTLKDENGNNIPAGETGAIWIKGDANFLGYWDGPYSLQNIGDNTWITTGDRFRCDTTDRYWFCGRKDDLVKLHGLRVEIGEIEALLRSHETVKEAAVLLEGEGLNAKLAAYITPHGAEQLTLLQIKEFLAASLPVHMVVDKLTILSSLPRNANGKIDRQALALAVEASQHTNLL